MVAPPGGTTTVWTSVSGGTSMASPHVAGVAALVVGEGVTDPDMVEKILKDTARKPDAQKFTADKYGAGIIDAPAFNIPFQVK